MVQDLKIIKESFKMRAVWRYYLYWMLSGLKPKFQGLYFYQLRDVYGIDQGQYGQLGMIAAFSIVFGSITYQAFLKEKEMRTLTYAYAFCGILINSVNYLQAKRYNLDAGVSDMALLSVGSGFMYATEYALNTVPSIVLFQKLVPEHVEATLMAFSMSMINFS